MALLLCKKVQAFAYISRFCVLILQAIFNLLLPDHDANVFNPPQVGERGVLDWVVELAFGGCRRWDSLYFLHVAEHGYTYENSMAFFPLFPWLVRGLANSLLLPLQALISYGNVLLLSAVLLNIYCFTRAAQALFALGKKVLNNEALAYKAALLFCINPASIFMTAAYSESLFAMISFTAMCNFEGGSTVLGALQFGLTGLVRSNGIVSFGFVFYKKLKDFANMLMSMGKLKFTDIKSQVLITVSSLGIVVVPSLLYGILCCTPFALYQYYSYLMYCTDDKTNTIPETILKYGREQGFKLPDGTHSPWCRYSVPLSYSYIQSHHWNVGFLKYYQLKQIPNFLLASPMLVLCLALVRYYVSRNWRYSLTLGLEVPALNQGEGDRKNVTASGFESKNCFVFVVHLLFLVLFGTFFMHIQVLTRFIASSSPAIYWYAAMVITSQETANVAINRYDIVGSLHASNPVESPRNRQSKLHNLLTDQIYAWDSNSFRSKLILAYCIIYFLVGTGAHANFLPWT